MSGAMGALYMMSTMYKMRVASGVRALAACALVASLAACTDGTTPDCSDAQAGCGTSIDAGSVAHDASTDAGDTGAPDTSTDAPNADADAATTEDTGTDASDASAD
jgi:hypothetical protein